jgi:hypothetical protein
VAVIGLAAAYFRFRRTPEARANVDVDIEIDWRNEQHAALLAVAVVVRNKGGLPFDLVSYTEEDTQRIGSVIGVYASVPCDTLVASVEVLQWDPVWSDSASLFSHDQRVFAGDSWHGSFGFQLPPETSIARAVALIEIRGDLAIWQRLLRRKRRGPEIVQTDQVALRPDEGGQHAAEVGDRQDGLGATFGAEQGCESSAATAAINRVS